MEGQTGKIVHVAAEVILLGGIAFYFNNQVKSLRNEVRELKLKLEEITESNNKHLNNLYSLMDKMNRTMMTPPASFFPKPSMEGTMGLRQRKKPAETPPISRPAGSGKKDKPVSFPPLEELDEEDVLDRELGEELTELQEEPEEEEAETDEILAHSTGEDLLKDRPHAQHKKK